MREVAVDGFVPAPPSVVRRRLSPERVVEYEGSFDVYDVREADGATVVVAGGPGVALSLRFEERGDTLHYAQEGEGGPFEAMETRIAVDAEDEGSRVTVRSSVSLGVPLPFGDRIAAWKRRGELERLVENLAADV